MIGLPKDLLRQLSGTVINRRTRMSGIIRLLGISALAGTFSLALASTASAVVVYENGFENGEIGTSSNCTGTDFLLDYTGCFIATPPATAGGGSGNFAAYAQPGQTNESGSVVPGSAASFITGPLPTLYTGRYEFTFEGTGIRELRFAEGFTAIFVAEEGGSPTGYPLSPSGTGLTIDGDSYSVLIDFDIRNQFFDDIQQGDFGRQAFCGIDEPITQCNFRFAFAVSSGGWIDNLRLNLLAGDPVAAPEPATGAMMVAGLMTAGVLMRRSRKENRMLEIQAL
jgi:hypothetical protein